MLHFLRALCSHLSFRHLSFTKCWEDAKLVLNARCQSIQFQALAFTPPSLSLSHPGKTISLTLGWGGGDWKKEKSQLLILYRAVVKTLRHHVEESGLQSSC